jgi:hypothetical protein
MGKRVIMRIEIAPSSKDRLDQFCDGTGMTKLAAVSRLIDWFCDQEDTVQAMVQRLYPALIEADVAAIILEKTAGRGAEAKRRSATNGNNGARRFENRSRRVPRNRALALNS